MILTVVFVFLYKFFDELQDESVNSAWEKGPVNFLNKYPGAKRTSMSFPDMGWARKWSWQYADNVWQAVELNETPWWYFGLIKNKRKERFMYSSTLLICMTDGEHLFQLFKDICIGLAIASASSSPWIGLAAFLATFLLGLVKEARK
jgi:hypothetical protein